MNGITDSLNIYAEKSPEKIALYTKNQTFTYKEWHQLISQTASWLQSLDVPNKVIGIHLPNRYHFLQLFLGAAMAGWIAVPLDIKWKQPELEKRVKLASPSVFITENVEEIAFTYPHIQSLAHCMRDIHQSSPIFSEVEKKHLPFYMGFTSGTTGNPKSFVRSHESWVASFECSRKDFGLNESDHVLIPGALIHSHFLYGAISVLALGGTVSLLEKFIPAQTIDVLKTNRITALYVVPTMVEALLKFGVQISNPIKLISSGAKWSENSKAEIRKILTNVEIIEFYGAGELSFVSFLSDDASSKKPGTVGKACSGVEIQIRNEENGMITKPHETGKIYVRSKLLISGYLCPETQTLLTIQDEDGWATVHDMGYIDDDGYLFISGREHNMILYGGINIFPEEIENILMMHPLVEETAVIGQSDPYWGQIIVAVIKGHAEIKELKRLCQEHLSAYKVPRRWHFVDEMPHTTSGKIARAQLHHLFESQVNSH